MLKNEKNARVDYLVIFIISLVCISLELFFTRMLNFKTWNHVVYVIIPFAILGYGMGSTLYMISQPRMAGFKKEHILSGVLVFLSVSTIISTVALIYLPIRVDYMVNFFTNIRSVLMLLVCYSIVMIPFVVIGFVVVYLFSVNSALSNKLYFIDLVGAGAGAIIFFLFINEIGVFRSLLILSFIILALASIVFWPRHRLIISILCAAMAVILLVSVPELEDYSIDRSKGFEWIPGTLQPNEYRKLVTRWHPFGRTDIYSITEPSARDYMYYKTNWCTFEINVFPLPELSFVATNFLAGTPIYRLTSEDLQERTIVPFSQAMEFPYVFLTNPKVMVIGVGGGRDIILAKSHGAREVVGAEVNPVTHGELSPGGKLYDYSGRVYTWDGVNVLNTDGRHMVKTMPYDYFDLIVFNGTDTFTGLSIGAYTYAESYLYTKDAILDYLHILKPTGMINFNRGLEPGTPRESLRLLTIAFDALREYGIKEPWEHVIIGGHSDWALTLIKKSPFTVGERERLKQYFETHNSVLLFPTSGIRESAEQNITYFDLYKEYFIRGVEKDFVREYPFDISVISDDNPFFYKYYKLSTFNPFNIFREHHSGTIVFMTQGLILVQAVIFILLFIFLPLFMYKRLAIKRIPAQVVMPFVVFFSCLGVGFMFIEIPVMQRFTLLLGNPIYSIAVTLTALLVFSGLGSFLSGKFSKFWPTYRRQMLWCTIALVIFLVMFILGGTVLQNLFMSSSFFLRVVVIFLVLFPLGLCLGLFFPAGLSVVGKQYQSAIAWAWGINCGFSVLGSILAITLAQFYGFNAILSLAALIYILALIAFIPLEKAIIQ